MISINCGCNFDPELPSILDNLNKTIGRKTGIKITEVYGSVPGIGLGSVRSKSRLKSLSFEETRIILRDFKAKGIQFNYTVNRSVIGTLQDLETSFIFSGLESLTNLINDDLISRITVCHPLIMEEFAKRFKIPIEISTVTEIATPLQMRKLKERVPTIDKICMHLHTNRNFPLLKEFVEVGERLGIKIELLLNEFCTFQCPDRRFCYNLQSVQKFREDIFDTYPHGRCIKDRDYPVEWLKARFILPQWMEDYGRLAKVRNFKLTGRTHPTSYIEKVASAYLKGEWTGNLLDLWAHLENIEKEGNSVGPKFHIPTESLEFDKFIKNGPFAFGDSLKGFYCDLACGGCTYCARYLSKIEWRQLR